MNIEEVRTFCLALPGVTEDMPYGPDVLVFRIEGKIFMHIGLEREQPTIAIKHNPDKGTELREKHDCITPAFHMNKTHWSDVVIENTLPDAMIQDLIRESYTIVFNKLPKAVRAKYPAD
ncbi:MAG: MmcQ/YjbR family DNA-binding protein [Bacteroidales bacterium]|nr:MmcQ/YjbR family DNA-binding protein [Bacteroidales bacterium]